MPTNQAAPGIGGIPDPYDIAMSNLSTFGWGTSTMASSSNSPSQADALSPAGFTLPQTVLGQPLSILAGMIILLLIFKYAGEHESVDLDPRDLHIGAYNLIAVGLTASVFIVVSKALTTRYNIPGVSQFFNYI